MEAVKKETQQKGKKNELHKPEKKVLTSNAGCGCGCNVPLAQKK